MSTRPPIPRGAPPPYAFVGRIYTRPLRPLVMGFSFVAALWCFVWGGSALWDISDSGEWHYIVIVNIVLGILFLFDAFIELFGFYAAMKARLSLARTYAYLSIIACLVVMGAECLRFSVYFTEKSNLIGACVADAMGTGSVNYGNFWGPTPDQTLTQPQAQQYCNDAWTRSVWASAIWLVVSIFLSFLYISLSFAFYHQLLMPARDSIAPSQAYNLSNMQRGPYNPQSGYQYPAPPGAPSTKSTDEFVPPYDPAKVPDYYESQGLEAPSGKNMPVDFKGDDHEEVPTGFGYSGSSHGHDV